MAKTKYLHIPRVARTALQRSARVLDMLYKPSELADELGLAKEQVMRMIAAGAPVQRDATNHYWIHGPKFLAWMEKMATFKRGDRPLLPEGQTYCLGCKSVVTYKETSRNNQIAYGKCPAGHTTRRFISDKKVQRAEKPKRLPEGQMYCLKCKSIVTYKETMRSGRISLGLCPEGHKISRFISIKKGYDVEQPANPTSKK